MTAATSRLRRRGIGAGVAALVGLSGLGFAAMPAQAAAGFNPAATQVSGVDRFDTAAQIATKAFTTATTVVVANGDRAIDAQAGAYVAGLNNAPILLTQKSNVPTYTVDAIKKLGATKAIVLGDSNSVDATALAQMTAAGLTVQVVSGTDRFATAAAIYNLGTTKASTVFLARADLLAGQVSPDALAASPLSYDGTPVLLTNAGSLPQATADAIKNGGVKNVVVLGNAITDSVKTAITALGATVTTIAGDDRSLTAQKIADYGIAQGKFLKTTATIANGDKIDALAAGPWAAKNSAPILLTLGTNSLGTGTTNYLTANASTLTTGVAFGDTNSVPATLTAAAKTAAGGNVTSLQTVAVAPTAATSFTLADEGVPATAASDDRTYTVTGLTAGTTYRMTLVNADSIRTAADGSVTFLSSADAASPSGFSVDPGADIANITSVNNAAPPFTTVTTGGAPAENIASRTVTVQPVNGSITFTVDGTDPGSVVPVVYVNGAAGQTASNGGTSTRLETSATVGGAYAAATESYGLGGAVAYVATRAANGAFGTNVTSGPTAIGGSATITAVDKTGNTFTATVDTDSGATNTPGARSFAFDANDTFTVGGASVGLDTFKAALSAGDSVQGSYATDAGGVSTFALTDVNPLAPTTVAAVAGATNSTLNDITVTVTPADANYDSVVIQRAPVTGGTVGTYATIASPTTDADLVANGFQYMDNDLAAGTYRYRAAVVNDGDQGDYTAATVDTTSTAPSTDSTAPTALDTRVGTNGAGSALTLNSGATFTVAFSEPVNLPASGATIRLSDADGTVIDYVVGAAGPATTVTRNATATTIGGTSYAINTVLTFTVGTPTQLTPGTAAGLSLPTGITAQSGVTDVNGNAWNISGSADATIDNE
ncbi:beta strand repeat-containing protein [Kineococcus sp. GCM10028916]|uniref:beta strand repeat-containing protein n=1 Tax=Kineococcus sp. GCM10028916 TaxID=3273394 RepID=UPI00362E30DE